MPDLTVLASIALLLGGVVLYGLAWQRRTPECPGITLNPRNWRAVWQMQDWFTPGGYRYNLAGSICIVIAGLLTTLNLLLNSA